MADSLDIQSLINKYPEVPYVFMAVVSYTLSLLFGITEFGGTVEFYGIHFHLVSTTLWAVFGMLSLYCLYTAFFDMWIYAIHLIVAYFLAGAGFLAVYIFYDDINLVIFGSILIFFSFAFIIYFIYKVGSIRSYRILRSGDPEAAKESYSLGSWYISPFLFFAITAISFLDLGYWYEHDNHFPFIHLLAEVSLIIIVTYMLWVPENVLFYGVKEEPPPPIFEVTRERMGEPRPSRLQIGTRVHKKTVGTIEDRRAEGKERESLGGAGLSGLMRKRKEQLENCPGLDSPPVSKEKVCPNCHNLMTMYWCLESEEYLITCPSCEKRTYYGRKVCVHCRSRLPESVTCDNCGRDYPLRKFKDG